MICTNHFQGTELGSSEINREHMRTSASVYRWQRVKELMDSAGKLTVPVVASILRNQRGHANKAIGMGNEKLINQLVAHHSVIFQPADLKVWVSTTSWQMGNYVCYDLKKIFASGILASKGEIYDSAASVASDPFVTSAKLRDFLKYAPFRFSFQPHTGIQPDSLVKWNPDCYLSYLLAGDEHYKQASYDLAILCYQAGLTKEVATLQEKEHMQRQLERCKEKIK